MAFDAIDVFSSKFALRYHVKVMEDVYRRATKAIAASYLQAYPYLPNEQLIIIMKADHPSLRHSAYFDQWILAMLVYQRNAYLTFGHFIYR